MKNGTFSGAVTVPAKPGDVIILWGTGFGPTNPSAPVGVETQSGSIYYTANPVTVTIGGTRPPSMETALAPGYAGLYRVAIQVPASLASGLQSPSNTMITVQE